MTLTMLAAFLAATAVLTLAGEQGRFALRRRGLSNIHGRGRDQVARRNRHHLRDDGRRANRSWAWPAATVLMAAAVLLAVHGVVVVLPALIAVPAVLLIVRTHRERARKRAADRNRKRAAVLLMDFSAELRAGRTPAEALARAAGQGNSRGVLAEPDTFTVLADVARGRGDVPAALRAVAREPGATAFERLVPCWQVAEHQGSGLAAAAERLVVSLRLDEARRREVVAHLAGARATARLLAGLPVIGILMGFGLGANPLDVLTRTPYGLACLGVGTVLQVAGIRWTDRMARSVEAAAGR